MGIGACPSKVGRLSSKFHAAPLDVPAIERKAELTQPSVGSSADESKIDGVGGDETGGLLGTFTK